MESHDQLSEIHKTLQLFLQKFNTMDARQAKLESKFVAMGVCQESFDMALQQLHRDLFNRGIDKEIPNESSDAA